MARIRTIKPSFFTSLTIADLTVEQRLTFVGLWTHSDDEGRSVYDPRLIKAAIWPLDDRTADDVADDVRALTESSLITHYTLSERSYLVINTWHEHQRINRPAPSTLPAPEDGVIVPLTCGDEDSLSAHGGLTEDSLWEGKGKEGKGTKTRPPAARPDRFDDWYATYKRKEGRGDAIKAYTKALKTIDHDELTRLTVKWFEDRPSTERQFIPLPASWLNAQRWTDEPPAPATNGRPASPINHDQWMTR